MWQSTKSLRDTYHSELTKQTEPYKYYRENIINNKDSKDEGEHENVPFICSDDIKKVSEDNDKTVYEYGEYVVLESKKGHADENARIKLITMAVKLNADLIYSDSDHTDCSGEFHTPYYKPCYSVNTFAAFDMYSEFYAVKKSLRDKDITCYENIVHVPEVLFHWACERNGDEISRLHEINNNSYKTDDFYMTDEKVQAVKNKVSIIMPSKDNPGLLEQCFAGIKNAKIKSRINSLELVLIDNGSTQENKTLITEVIKKTEDDGLTVKYIYEPADFNYSAMCQRGADESCGEYLLFMNDDIEVTDPLFMQKLLYFAAMDNVGAVGCKLLYPGDDRRIQHIGITCLKDAGPTHKLSTFPDDRVYYFGRNIRVHDCLAVTGACLMVSREKYFKTGGFYDKMKVGYNDVDLCVSLYEKGLVNVVNNDACLIHHESVTRGSDAKSAVKLKRLDDERKLLYERHPWLLEEGDPYYNVNLAEDFLEYRVNVVPDFEKRDYISPYVSEYTRKPDGRNVYFNIENINVVRDNAEISGWALINKKDNSKYETYVTVAGMSVTAYGTAKVLRKDLQAVFTDAKNTELSGFFARIPLDDFMKNAEITMKTGIQCDGAGTCSDKNMTGDGSNTDVNISADEIRSTLGIMIENKQTGKKYYAG